MDDAPFVRVFERLGELRRQRQRVVDRDSPARQPVGQCRAVDQLHDQRAHAGIVKKTVNLRDARVIEGGEKFGLALESRRAFVPRLCSGRPRA